MKRFIENYLLELEGIKRRLPVRRIETERWRLLETMHVKINFDAAYLQQNKKSCSIVIRNEEGQFLKAKVHQNKYIPNTFAAEAVACVQAAQFGVESGYLKGEIEGDALSVIRKLQNESDDKS
ncbi:hypothetical protein Goarm_023001 [Gossypium armourianum]|uniref:RNase H type-1 domain-containing protein n=1 Tax=Gossypium armourianum TaxID=34283 RepID=A0A7J9KHG4_9ROSI|nr:hypothetical protein [Gossypium armourianum]